MPKVDQEAIACRIAPEDRQPRYESIGELLVNAVEGRELDDGYAYRFRGDDASLDRLTSFITTERRCCPFLRFELTVEPDGRSIWLRLTGPEPVKRFVHDVPMETRGLS